MTKSLAAFSRAPCSQAKLPRPCLHRTTTKTAAGADPRAEWRGGTAIDYFHGGQQASVAAIDRLVVAGASSLKPDKLFEAAQYGYHAFAAALVRAGVDLTATQGGVTPLEFALQHKHLRSAIALAYKGKVERPRQLRVRSST